MSNNKKRKLDNSSLESDEKIKKIIKEYLGPKIDEVNLKNDEEISLLLDEIDRGSKRDSYGLSSIVSNKERRRIAKEKLIELELSESKETFDGKPMIVGKDNDGYDSDVLSDITQGGKGKKNKKKTLKKKKKTLKKRTRKYKKKSSKNTRKR